MPRRTPSRPMHAARSVLIGQRRGAHGAVISSWGGVMSCLNRRTCLGRSPYRLNLNGRVALPTRRLCLTHDQIHARLRIVNADTETMRMPTGSGAERIHKCLDACPRVVSVQNTGRMSRDRYPHLTPWLRGNRIVTNGQQNPGCEILFLTPEFRPMCSVPCVQARERDRESELYHVTGRWFW